MEWLKEKEIKNPFDHYKFILGGGLQSLSLHMFSHLFKLLFNHLR